MREASNEPLRHDSMTSLALGPTDRVLVLAPHPDDEVLGAGALLLAALDANASVHVAFATDGEANPWVQRIVERRWRIGPAERARFGVRRRTEALASLAMLGIRPEAVEFLALPDAGITSLMCAEDPRVASVLAATLTRVDPTVLVVPAPDDVHPDHGALGVLVRQILQSDARPPALRLALEFAVHTAPGAERTRPAFTVAPSRSDVRRLRAALRRHEAPMSWHRGEFLAHVGRPLEFGPGDVAHGVGERHPVLLATRGDFGLSLRVRARPRPGAFGASDLALLVGRAKDPVRSLSIGLGAHSGGVDVIRVAGGASVGRAHVERRGDRVLVRIPPGIVAADETVFAKVERRFGFFDEAGWLEVPPARNPMAAKAPALIAPRVIAVVPCYNVVGLCAPVVDELVRHADVVMAVDDGSTDGTGAVLAACAAAAPDRVEVLSLPVNQGKGAALLAAFARALASGPFDVLVTVDGDGQHRPQDVPPLAAACANGAGLAIGARDAFRRMPLRSRIGNTWTSVVVGRLCRGSPQDTQSGLRAHSRAFVEAVVASVEGTRYETELRILLFALASGVRVASVPIPTVYIDHNRSSHFRPLRDGVRVWGALGSWALFDRAHQRRARRRRAASPVRSVD